MTSLLSGAAVAFGFGFVYFLGALPAGVAAGAPIWLAGLAAWAGYSTGALVVLVAGAPLREALVRRFGVSLERDPSRLIWRAWDRAGLVGLGLLAPVTIGPQIGSILALAIGERAVSVLVALSLGVIPWCILFGALVGLGIEVVG